jgi:hypothetical protein
MTRTCVAYHVRSKMVLMSCACMVRLLVASIGKCGQLKKKGMSRWHDIVIMLEPHVLFVPNLAG